MTKLIPFPGQPPHLVVVATTLTLPFSRAQLLEIAAQINAASNEILASLEANGGSADTVRFLDFLWRASRGVLPEPAQDQ